MIRYRLSLAVIALLLIATPLITFNATRAQAGSYTTPWSAWSPWHYRALGALECAIAKTKAPARVRMNLWPGCREAWHYRTRTLADVSQVWEVGQIQVEGTALFRLWGVKIDSPYRYNGWQVFTDNGETCSSWAIGFDVTPLRCQTWNDGGANWGFLQVMGDWNIAAFWRGLPIKMDHGLFAQVNVSGIVMAQGGH